MTSINDISKRHMSSINDTGKKSMETIGIFQNPTEKSFYACAQKVEKIVTAIYLVTDVMDSELPLTRSLRDKSLGLLATCYALVDDMVSPRSVALGIVKIEEVMSLVGIGRITHHISEMNADIIETELSKVRMIMLGEHGILNERYTAYNRTSSVSQPVVSRDIVADNVFDQVSRERSVIHNVGRGESISLIKTTPVIKTTFKTTPINDMSEKIENQNDINKDKTTFKTTVQKITIPDRKHEILEIIKKNKNATINDIKIFFSDMSDKTLQRNIAKLIEMRLISREGNKRWATYSVVKN